jgi:hypothetical protein
MVTTIVRHNARLLFSPSGYFSLTRADSDNYCHLHVSWTVRQRTVQRVERQAVFRILIYEEHFMFQTNNAVCIRAV